MKKNQFIKCVALVTLACLGMQANAEWNFKGQSFGYTSPNGTTEECIITDHIPEGKYSKGDEEEETQFCKLDLYATNLAFCGKTWSTSAATIINALIDKNKKSIDMTSQDAERKFCPMGKKNPLKSIAKFKQTVSNDSGASGLFSIGSLLYYHISRYLDTTIDVPPAVMRTMDKEMYLSRIASKVKPTASMNIKAWQFMSNVAKNPSSLRKDAQDDILTTDLKRIYGVVLKDKGERYGAEINSARLTSGYSAQNNEIQETTPTFLALASNGNLKDAIRKGISGMSSDVKKAFKTDPSNTQMVLWMNEMSEMAVLDFILSQQDRIGNIDYRWYFMFLDKQGSFKKAIVESDFVLTNKANFMASLEKTYKSEDTSDLAQDARMYSAIKSAAQENSVELIQKTMIGDNDAGGKAYANFTKKNGYLQKFKHLNPELYRKIIKLSEDFKSKGAVYSFIQTGMGLLQKEVDLIVSNTNEVAQIFNSACKAGTLKFDLVSHKKALKNEFQEESLNCDAP